MKHLIVSVAGLGWKALESRGLTKLCGLEFRPADSVFPAVTCVAQASLRTGLEPREHGMTSNGFWSRTLMKPSFWEQASALVKGPRIWDSARTAGATVGMYFFQQSIGESVDQVISPAPIHKHEGGMIMRNYTKPPEMSERLDKALGHFPLWKYWGPLASAKVGDAVLANFFAMTEMMQDASAESAGSDENVAVPPDYAFLYLPTLDYEAQRFGPNHPKCDAAMKVFEGQLKKLVEFAAAAGAKLTVMGDYEIEAADLPPAMPNVTLRREGLFKVRPLAGMTYPDFNTSRAFAMCDHEIAHVYVKNSADVERTAEILCATGDYELVEIRADQSWANETAGEILIMAKKGSWCAYPWWTDGREAPDYATHIDIHNKPGYDPCELFFNRKLGFLPVPSTCQDWSRIRGTHGRPSKIAWASTDPDVTGDSLIELARKLV